MIHQYNDIDLLTMENPIQQRTIENKLMSLLQLCMQIRTEDSILTVVPIPINLPEASQKSPCIGSGCCRTCTSCYRGL